MYKYFKPNYQDIDWGSFTEQFKHRKQKNIKSLKDYANYILEHPQQFHPKTKKRANFYKNVIKGGMVVRSFPEYNDDVNY